MWSCAECYSKMEDDIDECTKCGCPNPASPEYKEFIEGEKLARNSKKEYDINTINISQNENTDEKIEGYIEKCKFAWPFSAMFNYMIALVLMCIGLFKMFVYRNSEYSWEEPINAYVGGDGYNYIINSNYAIGFFVLALIFILIGSTIVIIHAINYKK